jgi:hypothetical protein
MALVSEVRFCRDCRYRMGKLCQHPSLTDVNLVTGAREGYRRCNEMREPIRYGVEQPCGPEGKLWEPKPLPLWQRLFNGSLAWIGSLLTRITTTRT